MGIGTIVIIIAVVIIAVIGMKKLIAMEDIKNNPNLSEPRDTNTEKGNQGTLEKRNKPD